MGRYESMKVGNTRRENGEKGCVRKEVMFLSCTVSRKTNKNDDNI